MVAVYKASERAVRLGIWTRTDVVILRSVRFITIINVFSFSCLTYRYSVFE